MNSKQVDPTYSNIMDRCGVLASEYKEITEKLDIGTSEAEKRELPCLKITNQTVPIDEKQIMLVTGGVHGSEECGRAAAMAFAEWLCIHGTSHLAAQCFIVCPCMNPDGAEKNNSLTGTGKNIYNSCRIGSHETETKEAGAILKLADEYLPECCVDMHGLAGGSVGDTIYVTPGLAGNLSTQIGFAVAYEMSRAASAAGFPQRDPYLQKEYNDMSSGVSWVKKSAWEMNTLSFTVEMSEHMYPLSESVWSGLARMIKLVEIGERIEWYQPYPGYPVDILTNNGVVALMPHGTTPGQRRQSRKEIMTAIHEGGIWHVDRDAADHAQNGKRTGAATLTCRKELKTYPSRFTIQMMLDRRAQVCNVLYNGTELSSSPIHGFEERFTGENRFVRININQPPESGDNRAEIMYQMPVSPHDPLISGDT